MSILKSKLWMKIIQESEEFLENISMKAWKTTHITTSEAKKHVELKENKALDKEIYLENDHVQVPFVKLPVGFFVFQDFCSG